jgi:hypothetical protein
MAAIIALLPQLIALIPTISTGVSNLITFIASVRTAATQTGDWTPALEAQFVAALIASGSSHAWQTDAQLAAAAQAKPAVA